LALSYASRVVDSSQAAQSWIAPARKTPSAFREATAESSAPVPYDFAGLPIHAPSIPVAGEEEVVDVNGADAGAPTQDAGRPDAGPSDAGLGPIAGVPAPSCAPISMRKLTSGTFENSLGLNDYYPDLVGRGYWDSPTTAGPFDIAVGSDARCGSSIQLMGTVPAACAPAQYKLGQTVKYTKAVFDGVRDPMEGIVQDDIAKSGRDASRPPFRQEWNNATGHVVSMADPPSVLYKTTSNIDFDREFVTSLTGPDGSVSVNWSTSIRVASGTVARNTIT
jgi:hypothetical protein